MAQNSRRRNILIAVAVIILAALLLLLTRCIREKPTPTPQDSRLAAPAAPTPPRAEPPAEIPSPQEPGEVLGAATLTAPAQLAAGAPFSVAWTGPDNRADFITIVRADAPDDAHGHYRETLHGATVELTAPIDPGAHEVRYVTGRSRTVLARLPVEVLAAAATLDAPAEVTLGSPIQNAWTGPSNEGDYITIVPSDAPDEQYGSYTETTKGSPLTLTAPTTAGDAELRYVSGQGRRVLARRPIRVAAAAVSLTAPADAIAGSTIEVIWTGPNNAGDYITVVAAATPDGQYGNYTDTSKGSPLGLLTPIMAGAAELRYMTGQGRRVLARRPITITAAEVTLSAPQSCAAGAAVSVTWTGPGHRGDYITVVPKGTPDGQYRAYTETSAGSPLSVTAPKEPGEAEVRYMTGQGNKVLARIPIQILP
jgi:hypothetical protein